MAEPRKLKKFELRKRARIATKFFAIVAAIAAPLWLLFGRMTKDDMAIVLCVMAIFLSLQTLYLAIVAGFSWCGVDVFPFFGLKARPFNQLFW